MRVVKWIVDIKLNRFTEAAAILLSALNRGVREPPARRLSGVFLPRLR